MTDEQLLQVLATVKMLDPTLVAGFSAIQLETFIDMAVMFIEASGLEIPEDKYILAVAVKTLSLLSIPETSSLEKKKIKDVEISYYEGQGKSRWDAMFDAIINGTMDGEKALYYVGI